MTRSCQFIFIFHMSKKDKREFTDLSSYFAVGSIHESTVGFCDIFWRSIRESTLQYTHKFNR